MMIAADPNITVQQIQESLLGIVAFVPAMVCTGYLAAWFTNLHGFRRRSLVERIFWSVPLSMAISTIAAVLIGRFVSLGAVVALFVASAVAWVALLGWEWRARRASGERWVIGWRPLGGMALLVAALWVAVAVLSVVDLQNGQHLFMNVANWDQSYRVNWTEAVLRTGVPPENPLYWYKHSANLRNYYFWYVLCAAVVRMAHLSARAVFIASCAWSGFALVALIGLYLKHFLGAGERLRRQFLLAVGLLAVTGLDLCVNLWNLFGLHQPLPADLEWWSKVPVDSWYDSLFWAPHHVASMVCCLFAFLLAWLAARDGERRRAASVVLIAAALASAFGLSIYVAFGFFLVMLVWGFWQVALVRAPRAALLLGAGGAGAAILLAPYLWELAHDSGGTQGGSMFGLVVREIIPPDALLASRVFLPLAASHPFLARNLANLLLLGPGYVLELGFYLAVLLIFLVPAWRGRKPLTAAQRSLVFIAAATIPFVSLMRSLVLKYDDFSIRAVLILQFVLLLLASELLTGWRYAESRSELPADCSDLPHRTPQWLRSAASLAFGLGVLSTVCQALLLRFVLPLAEANMTRRHDPEGGALSHNAYISAVGYARLDAAIPQDAIVQFNPAPPNLFWLDADLIGVNHSIAINSDQDGCGSSAGGDPSGCPAMAAAVDSLYKGTTAEQAREVCGELGIQYLIARVYDPAWKDRTGWVWTLRPVVNDAEFRALDCRN